MSIPTKLSSLKKKAGAAKIDELMLSMEIKMEKLPHEVFVSFVERALAQVDNAQRLKRTFQKCGLDPYDEDKLLFAQHLESLSKEALYKSLIEAQKSRVYFWKICCLSTFDTCYIFILNCDTQPT